MKKSLFLSVAADNGQLDAILWNTVYCRPDYGPKTSQRLLLRHYKLLIINVLHLIL